MDSHLFIVPGGKYLLLVPGNIDLLHRPRVRNTDGSISTTYSSSFTVDGGKVILLPGVIRDSHGRWIATKSRSLVLAAYRKTGQFFGVFKNEAAAKRYADLLHLQQARLLGMG